MHCGFVLHYTLKQNRRENLKRPRNRAVSLLSIYLHANLKVSISELLQELCDPITLEYVTLFLKTIRNSCLQFVSKYPFKHAIMFLNPLIKARQSSYRPPHSDDCLGDSIPPMSEGSDVMISK